MKKEIKDHTTPQYFIAYGPDGTRHIGITEVGQVTTTGQPELFNTEHDAEFLSMASEVGIPDDFTPLPEQGEQVNTGIYAYNGKLVICRQNHVRTEHAVEDIPALFSFYRENAEGMKWIESEPVKVGDTRMYKGKTYTAIQSHTTQSDWTPEIATTLWELIDEGTPESDAWRVGESVNIGDIRTYKGNTYSCRQAHTTQAGWTPPVVPALWLLV